MELRKVIEGYKALDLNLEYISNENKNLKKVLDTEDVEKVSNIVLAKVLVDRNSPFLKSIIINKGSKEGIIKGMPVTQNKYLIGRIVETNYLSSRVLLLNDLNSRIPVTFDEKSTQAILTGRGSRNPKLDYLPEGYQFIDGITVFASGKDGIFNAGTPIGKTKENGDVDLFVDPNQLSFVTVNLVKPTKEVLMAKGNILSKLFASGPLLLLYYLSISEVDTNLEKLFEIFSLNLQIIIIYFLIIKRPSLMGTGHIFFAGLINDVVMGFPLGLSSLSYLVVCFVGNYVRNKSVNTTIASDWFTFLIALLFANLLFFSLLNNFSEVAISFTKIGYNTFFTLFAFPVFWLLFNLYQLSFIGSQDA